MVRPTKRSWHTIWLINTMHLNEKRLWTAAANFWPHIVFLICHLVQLAPDVGFSIINAADPPRINGMSVSGQADGQVRACLSFILSMHHRWRPLFLSPWRRSSPARTNLLLPPKLSPARSTAWQWATRRQQPAGRLASVKPALQDFGSGSTSCVWCSHRPADPMLCN